MILQRPSSCSAARRAVLRTAATGRQRAYMHLGRATSEDTKEFLSRGERPVKATAKLRVGKRASNGAESASPFVHVSRRGVGSPYLWAKDVPRIDASKDAISRFQSNFLQVCVCVKEFPFACAALAAYLVPWFLDCAHLRGICTQRLRSIHTSGRLARRMRKSRRMWNPSCSKRSSTISVSHEMRWLCRRC